MEACVRTSFLLEADAPLHGWTTFCLSIICQWIFVLLCFLAVVDNAIVNTGVQMSLKPCFQFFWGMHAVNRTGEPGFQFLHILTNTYYSLFVFLVGAPGSSAGKESACNAGEPPLRFNFWVGKIC